MVLLHSVVYACILCIVFLHIGCTAEKSVKKPPCSKWICQDSINPFDIARNDAVDGLTYKKNLRTKASDMFHDISGNPDIKVISEVHDTGHYTSLCWTEITTITETKNGSKSAIREYAITFETPSDIPDKYLSKKPDLQLDGETVQYKIYDRDTKKSEVVNFTTISKSEDSVVRQNRKVLCGSGPIYTKEFMEWPHSDRKRVEIRVSPKRQNLVATDCVVLNATVETVSTPEPQEITEEQDETKETATGKPTEQSKIQSNVIKLVSDSTLKPPESEDISLPSKLTTRLGYSDYPERVHLEISTLSPLTQEVDVNKTPQDKSVSMLLLTTNTGSPRLPVKTEFTDVTQAFIETHSVPTVSHAEQERFSLPEKSDEIKVSLPVTQLPYGISTVTIYEKELQTSEDIKTPHLKTDLTPKDIINFRTSSITSTERKPEPEKPTTIVSDSHSTVLQDVPTIKSTTSVTFTQSKLSVSDETRSTPKTEERTVVTEKLSTLKPQEIQTTEKLSTKKQPGQTITEGDKQKEKLSTVEPTEAQTTEEQTVTVKTDSKKDEQVSTVEPTQAKTTAKYKEEVSTVTPPTEAQTTVLKTESKQREQLSTAKAPKIPTTFYTTYGVSQQQKLLTEKPLEVQTTGHVTEHTASKVTDLVQTEIPSTVKPPKEQTVTYATKDDEQTVTQSPVTEAITHSTRSEVSQPEGSLLTVLHSKVQITTNTAPAYKETVTDIKQEKQSTTKTTKPAVAEEIHSKKYTVIPTQTVEVHKSSKPDANKSSDESTTLHAETPRPLLELNVTKLPEYTIPDIDLNTLSIKEIPEDFTVSIPDLSGLVSDNDTILQINTDYYDDSSTPSGSDGKIETSVKIFVSDETRGTVNPQNLTSTKKPSVSITKKLRSQTLILSPPTRPPLEPDSQKAESPLVTVQDHKSQDGTPIKSTTTDVVSQSLPITLYSPSSQRILEQSKSLSEYLKRTDMISTSTPPDIDFTLTTVSQDFPNISQELYADKSKFTISPPEELSKLPETFFEDIISPSAVPEEPESPVSDDLLFKIPTIETFKDLNFTDIVPLENITTPSQITLQFNFTIKDVKPKVSYESASTKSITEITPDKSKSQQPADSVSVLDQVVTTEKDSSETEHTTTKAPSEFTPKQVNGTTKIVIIVPGKETEVVSKSTPANDSASTKLDDVTLTVPPSSKHIIPELPVNTTVRVVYKLQKKTPPRPLSVTPSSDYKTATTVSRETQPVPAVPTQLPHKSSKLDHSIESFNTLPTSLIYPRSTEQPFTQEFTVSSLTDENIEPEININIIPSHKESIPSEEVSVTSPSLSSFKPFNVTFFLSGNKSFPDFNVSASPLPEISSLPPYNVSILVPDNASVFSEIPDVNTSFRPFSTFPTFSSYNFTIFVPNNESVPDDIPDSDVSVKPPPPLPSYNVTIFVPSNQSVPSEIPDEASARPHPTLPTVSPYNITIFISGNQSVPSEIPNVNESVRPLPTIPTLSPYNVTIFALGNQSVFSEIPDVNVSIKPPKSPSLSPYNITIFVPSNVNASSEIPDVDVSVRPPLTFPTIHPYNFTIIIPSNKSVPSEMPTDNLSVKPPLTFPTISPYNITIFLSSNESVPSGVSVRTPPAFSTLPPKVLDEEKSEVPDFKVSVISPQKYSTVQPHNFTAPEVILQKHTISFKDKPLTTVTAFSKRIIDEEKSSVEPTAKPTFNYTEVTATPPAYPKVEETSSPSYIFDESSSTFDYSIPSEDLVSVSELPNETEYELVSGSPRVPEVTTQRPQFGKHKTITISNLPERTTFPDLQVVPTISQTPLDKKKLCNNTKQKILVKVKILMEHVIEEVDDGKLYRHTLPIMGIEKKTEFDISPKKIHPSVSNRKVNQDWNLFLDDLAKNFFFFNRNAVPQFNDLMYQHLNLNEPGYEYDGAVLGPEKTLSRMQRLRNLIGRCDHKINIIKQQNPKHITEFKLTRKPFSPFRNKHAINHKSGRRDFLNLPANASAKAGDDEHSDFYRFLINPPLVNKSSSVQVQLPTTVLKTPNRQLADRNVSKDDNLDQISLSLSQAGAPITYKGVPQSQYSAEIIQESPSSKESEEFNFMSYFSSPSNDEPITVNVETRTDSKVEASGTKKPKHKSDAQKKTRIKEDDTDKEKKLEVRLLQSSDNSMQTHSGLQGKEKVISNGTNSDNNSQLNSRESSENSPENRLIDFKDIINSLLDKLNSVLDKLTSR
ncbi:hypothetical protein ILUMI_08532 [Ignelater luminosus]|uniref:Uncharacterized protein n=1 Tax=Ignelater luminosus TaxID=2038154 RepID=A0A8K0GDB2_IGNLU|nr:hypothetical protein ILUMI_08532 [Ignelater luminosus]